MELVENIISIYLFFIGKNCRKNMIFFGTQLKNIVNESNSKKTKEKSHKTIFRIRRKSMEKSINNAKVK